jgi:hypothetical protein
MELWQFRGRIAYDRLLAAAHCESESTMRMDKFNVAKVRAAKCGDGARRTGGGLIFIQVN